MEIEIAEDEELIRTDKEDPLQAFDWISSGISLLWQSIAYVSSAIQFSGSTDSAKSGDQTNRVRIGENFEANEQESLGDQFALLNEAFRMFDLDGSGRISKSEIRDVLRSLGHNPNEDQINLLIAQVDVDGNGTLDLSEFMEFMNCHFCSWTPASDLKCVFRLLDPKGSGLVSVSKIRDMILRYSYDFDESEVDEMVGDLRDDDKIDFERFSELVAGTRCNQ